MMTTIRVRCDEDDFVSGSSLLKMRMLMLLYTRMIIVMPDAIVVDNDVVDYDTDDDEVVNVNVDDVVDEYVDDYNADDMDVVDEDDDTAAAASDTNVDDDVVDNGVIVVGGDYDFVFDDVDVLVHDAVVDC
jgi:hypothetical protein